MLFLGSTGNEVEGDHNLKNLIHTGHTFDKGNVDIRYNVKSLDKKILRAEDSLE